VRALNLSASIAPSIRTSYFRRCTSTAKVYNVLFPTISTPKLFCPACSNNSLKQQVGPVSFKQNSHHAHNIKTSLTLTSLNSPLSKQPAFGAVPAPPESFKPSATTTTTKIALAAANKPNCRKHNPTIVPVRTPAQCRACSLVIMEVIRCCWFSWVLNLSRTKAHAV
jgi:hypothetical protein